MDLEDGLLCFHKVDFEALALYFKCVIRCDPVTVELGLEKLEHLCWLRRLGIRQYVLLADVTPFWALRCI